MNLNISISDICAITISALAIYISLKNRRNSLRENLYDRQIDAFQKVLTDSIVIESMIDEYFEEKKLNQKAEADELKEQILDKIEDFTLFDLTNSFLMPDKIDKEIFKVSEQFNSISVKLIKNTLLEEDTNALSYLLTDLQEQIRDFIGLEKLSRENEKLA